jgi:hypothetical protein
MSNGDEQPTLREAEQMLRNGLAKVMREAAAQYTAPLA